MQGERGREGTTVKGSKSATRGLAAEQRDERRKKDDRGSTRNYNLLIRSQTRYHYATRPVKVLRLDALTNFLHPRRVSVGNTTESMLARCSPESVRAWALGSPVTRKNCASVASKTFVIIYTYNLLEVISGGINTVIAKEEVSLHYCVTMDRERERK